MKGEIFLFVFLCFIISFSSISNPIMAVPNASSITSNFLSVDKSSGYYTDTFTFNITFATVPNATTPFRLEYQPFRSSSWQIFGSQSYISDFQKNGNSIYDVVIPSDSGIMQGGTYDFRAVYGIPDQFTNLVSITFASTVQPPIQQIQSQRLTNFYVWIAVIVIIAFLLIFAFISYLMKSPTEMWSV